MLSIFEYFVILFFSFFLVSHNWFIWPASIWPMASCESLILPGTTGHVRMNSPHIFPSYCTPSPFHDKGYFPCCMCTNDKMWMWFHLFVCLFFLSLSLSFFLDHDSISNLSAAQYIHLCCFPAGSRVHWDVSWDIHIWKVFSSISAPCPFHIFTP